MKEKGLYLTTALLLLLLIFGIYQENKASLTKNNEKPVIGILQYVSHPSLDEIEKGIEEGLKKEGYTAKNSEILLLNAQAEQSKIQTMGQQLIAKSAVMIGIATPAAQGLANQSKKIPILMGAISYPEQAGLIKDEKHPDGNITGVSDRSPVKAQLKLIQTLLPKAKNIAILYSSNEDNAKVQAKEAHEKANDLGLITKNYVVNNTNDIKNIAQKALSENDALYLPTDNTIASGFDTVVQAAKNLKKPIFPSVSDQVKQGGLATIGINQRELGIQTGKMAAEILKGKSVANLPVYVFEEGEKILNETVAKELGLTFSEELKKDAQLIQ